MFALKVCVWGYHYLGRHRNAAQLMLIAVLGTTVSVPVPSVTVTVQVVDPQLYLK